MTFTQFPFKLWRTHHQKKGNCNAAACQDQCVYNQAVKRACSDKCPNGWTSYSVRCYLYNGTTLDWASAETFCQKFDAHLVSIHSENEYQQVKALIRTYDPTENPTYIGLSDCQKTYQFFWSDGTKLTFTKWNSGEPNNNNKECCVQMNYATDKNWNDIPCDLQYPKYNTIFFLVTDEFIK